MQVTQGAAMRTYRLFGASIEELRSGSEPIPLPRENQVLVRIRAASLNFKDLIFVKPAHAGGIELPRPTIPLSDAAGEIVALGPCVTAWKPGDRVMAVVVQKWHDGPIPAEAPSAALGYGIDGVLCEYRVFDDDCLVHLPQYMSFEEGSTLPIACLTAWNGVRNVADGETVLILGTGGVALCGLQLAKARGARVIITSSSNAKLERAKLLGADAGINYRECPAWHEQVHKLTAGRGADHVVETVSGSNLTQSVAATAIGGHVYLVGLQDRGPMDPYQIQYRAVNVHGIRMGPKTMFEEMTAFVAKHRIHPVIDHIFPFAEVHEAYAHLAAAEHFGKIVIRT